MKNYELVFEDNFKTLDTSRWIIIDKPQNAPWAKYMGIDPEVTVENDEAFLRLPCRLVDGEIKTAGIQTRREISEGRVEVIAKFKGGLTSWPAIWMLNCANGAYHEIDICEYFGKRFWCKTGLFMRKHLKWGFNRLFRPKRHPFIKRNDWNKFVCEWDSDSIRIYVNDHKTLVYKYKESENEYPQTADNKTFALILSMQYGHGKIFKPRTSQLPLWMDIKSVKYEKLL